MQRIIKAAGSTVTELLDARGKKVALEKPRDTLFAMLEHFCLDATNPLTIITQDRARHFLCGEGARGVPISGWAAVVRRAKCTGSGRVPCIPQARCC